jgi:CHAT domain-containing protein/tetratricopeptide (TPR) repeat protein
VTLPTCSLRVYVWAMAVALILGTGTLTGLWSLRSRVEEWRVDWAMRELISAVGTSRFSEARLGEAFAWGARPSPVRGSERARMPASAVEAGLKLRALAESRRTSATLHALAVALLSEGHVDDAISVLQDSLRVAPKAAVTHVDLSAALWERWRRTQQAEDAGQALDEAERARQLQPQLASALWNRALALEAVGLSSEAQRAWAAYLAIAGQNLGWREEALQHLSELALAEEPSSEVDLHALTDRHLEQLARSEPLQLYRQLENYELPHWSDEIVAGRAGDLKPALRMARALEVAGRDRYLVDLTRLAAVSSAKGGRLALAKAVVSRYRWWDAYDATSYADARRMAVDERDLLARAGARTPDVDLRLSLIDMGSGHTADALARLSAIESIARARHYDRMLAIAYHIRGLASTQRNAIDEAVAAYFAARNFAEKAGDMELIGLSNAYLATAHAAQGARSAAWADLSACARQLRASVVSRRRYQYYSRAAALAHDAGLDGLGLVVSDALLADPVEQRQEWSRLAGYLLRARAFAALGFESRATADVNAAHSLAVAIQDRAFRDEALAEVAITTGEVLVTADPRRAARALSDGLAFEQVRANQFRSASLLLARGRAYMHAGDRQKAEGDWLEGVKLLEDTRLSIRDAQLRIARTSDTWDLFQELVNVQRDRPAEALQTVERTHARELLDSIAADTDLEQFRRVDNFSWLPTNTVALVYSTQRDRLLIWRVTAKSVVPLEQRVSLSALREMVDISVRDVQRGLDLDRGLSDVLVPKALDLTGSARLVVVPDGPLYQVPFGYLRTGHGARVLDSLVVTVAPSLAVLKALLQRPALPERPMALLVGAGQSDPTLGLPALPGVGDEIEALKRIYPAAHVLTGANATAQSVLREIRQADLLHFAGHAISDPVHPALSRLLLAPGGDAGSLRPSQIAASRMRRGGMVVLGACGTAAGQTFNGEGPLNLARPFLVTGASAVIGTLWPISDRDTTTIMTAFHSLISQGVSPALALTSVQRRLPPVSQATLAAFVLIGRS